MKRFTEQNGPDVRGRGSKFVGHFAGLTLIRKDAQREPERRAHPVDQQAVEAMLADRARPSGSRCAATVMSPASCSRRTASTWSGHPRPAKARSDAPTSSVATGDAARPQDGRLRLPRHAAHVDDVPGRRRDRPSRTPVARWHRTSGGMFSYGPLPGRLVMLDFSGPPEDRQAPVTREEIEAVLRRISGADVRVNAIESGSRWTDNTRLVDTYRRGRVLLAGDAAHVHSPFGGQGLSLGLVDAANLGWKLAAVVRGEMPESLLDTYTAERRPVAEAVLANTLAQMAIMRPDPQSGAMRDLVARPHAVRRRQPAHRRDDERPGHPLRSRVGAGRRRAADRRQADQPRRWRRLALRAHAGWQGRPSRRLDRGGGFRARREPPRRGSVASPSRQGLRC